MTNGKNIFDHKVKTDLKTYENIRMISKDQGDDYKTGCLLDYPYFKNYLKMVAMDLCKHQALDADPKAVQQITFTENLEYLGNRTMFFIIEEAKETILDFSQGTVRVWCFFNYLFYFKTI